MKAIELARKNVTKGNMRDSACLCLADAMRARDNGNLEAAKMWALKSIAYSVGMGHPDYIEAAE